MGHLLSRPGFLPTSPRAISAAFTRLCLPAPPTLLFVLFYSSRFASLICIHPLSGALHRVHCGAPEPCDFCLSLPPPPPSPSPDYLLSPCEGIRHRPCCCCCCCSRESRPTARNVSSDWAPTHQDIRRHKTKQEARRNKSKQDNDDDNNDTPLKNPKPMPGGPAFSRRTTAATASPSPPFSSMPDFVMMLCECLFPFSGPVVPAVRNKCLRVPRVSFRLPASPPSLTRLRLSKIVFVRPVQQIVFASLPAQEFVLRVVGER